MSIYKFLLFSVVSNFFVSLEGRGRSLNFELLKRYIRKMSFTSSLMVTRKPMDTNNAAIINTLVDVIFN